MKNNLNLCPKCNKPYFDDGRSTVAQLLCECNKKEDNEDSVMPLLREMRDLLRSIYSKLQQKN